MDEDYNFHPKFQWWSMVILIIWILIFVADWTTKLSLLEIICHSVEYVRNYYFFIFRPIRECLRKRSILLVVPCFSAWVEATSYGFLNAFPNLCRILSIDNLQDNWQLGTWKSMEQQMRAILQATYVSVLWHILQMFTPE